MSQSPVNDFSEQATLRYKQGWRALNRLLHEDRSFSGKERDCAFLNVGGSTPSFATVSGVVGFDFADDGRGLATADWDFDGDLDVWISCRTAPRVRFAKNNTSAKPFVAFKLQGDGILTNRDAIGARLELHLRDGKYQRKIRTLHGGEGFLSQSSNWVHFGLGDSTGIEKLIVRWPGGKAQEIKGLEPGKFYRINANSAAANPFTPPANRAPLTPSEPEVATLQESGRIIAGTGMPLPQLSTVAADGSKPAWQPTPGRPVAINIWATWCAPCIAELTEWAAHSKEITAAGLDIMAFNTDALGSNPSESPADPAAVLKKLGFLFPNSRISSEGMLALDFLQRAILDRWKPLPLPVTFLVDAKGELISIYKGPVTSGQLIADLRLGLLTADQRRDAMVPFPGHWVGKAGRSDPKRVANLMLDHDETDAAIEYLDRCAGVIAPQKTLSGYQHQLGDIYYMAGLLQPASPKHQSRAITTLSSARDLVPEDIRFRKVLAQQLFKANRGAEAVTEMLAAIKINPGDPTLQAELVDLYVQLGQFANARPILEAFLSTSPKNTSARLRLAGVLVAMGEAKAAIPHYRQTLKDSPRTLEAADELARLLASHPDDTIRSPEEALALAQRLCSITRESNPGFLDTLSIALANKGDYPQAITAAKKACALLADKPEETKVIQGRIKLYEAGQPWRQRP